jgi:NADP-dependent 3-hydroxy acid dehydrogenase YdfG
MQLEGAVVAITGAGRGIGRATAEAFADRDAIVCLGDLDGESAANAAAEIGAHAHPFQVDVRARESFADFIDTVQRTVGEIDVLVNNAGVMPSGPFLEEDDATLETVFGVNFAGPVYGMQLVLPGMIERRRGHVVNVASLLGKFELPGLASYVASKHALVGLSHAVRAELDGTGVTLTVVLPAIVKTELSAGIPIPWPISTFARVEPEDVARAIVSSCAHGPKELAVPRWLSVFPALRPLIPDAIETLVRKLFGDDRALHATDSEQRAAYAQRIAKQV